MALPAGCSVATSCCVTPSSGQRALRTRFGHGASTTPEANVGVGVGLPSTMGTPSTMRLWMLAPSVETAAPMAWPSISARSEISSDGMDAQEHRSIGVEARQLQPDRPDGSAAQHRPRGEPRRLRPAQR